MTLMSITVVDVIGRYGLNHPLPGSTELTEFCLGLLIFFTLPIICRKNQHIFVDLLEGWLSPGFKKWSTILIQGILFIGMSFLGYGMYVLMQRAKRDELVSEILLLPVSQFHLIIVFLIFFSIAAVILYSFSLLGDKIKK